MKALSVKVSHEKEKAKIDRYVRENYEEIIYNGIAGNAEFVSKQAAAQFLWALSMHGYGTKRLHDCFEWFLAVCNMPDQILGKTSSADDVIRLMTDKYGIDFDQMQMNFQSYEDFCRERGASKDVG